MRSHALSGLVAALVLVCLAGCQKPAPQNEAPVNPGGSANPQATTATPGELRLWTIWNSEPRKSALNKIVEQFQASHSGIKVQVSNMEPDAYKTKIRVALGGDSPPDIFFVWSGEKMLRNFIRGGNCLDLSKHMDGNSGEWRKRIVAKSLKAYEYDGKVWGIPFLLQCTFFAYNKDMLATHDIEAPKTWDQFIAACEKLKAAGVVPIALGNKEKWPAHHYPCVLFQRLMGHEAAMEQYDPLGPGDYADPGWVKGLQMFDEFQRKGFFSQSPNGVSRADARAMFYGEKAAMFYTGSWDFAQLSKGGEAPEEFWDKWDFFNFPSVAGGKGEQGGLAGSADGYVISRKTRNQDAAVAFLQYLTSREVARQFSEECRELVQVEGGVNERNGSWYLRKYADMVKGAEIISAWTDTMMEGSVADALMNGVQGMLAGQKTPEQIMDDVRTRQAAVKKELAARKVTGGK